MDLLNFFFLRNVHIDFHSGWNILHSQQQYPSPFLSTSLPVFAVVSLHLDSILSDFLDYCSICTYKYNVL